MKRQKKLQALKKNMYLVIVSEHPNEVCRNLNSRRLSQLNSTNRKQTNILSHVVWSNQGKNETLTYAGEGSSGRSQRQPESQQPTKKDQEELRVKSVKYSHRVKH